MSDAWITNLYASGGGTSTESGVYIADGCTSIRMTNGRISGMSKHGIHAAGQVSTPFGFTPLKKQERGSMFDRVRRLVMP